MLPIAQAMSISCEYMLDEFWNIPDPGKSEEEKMSAIVGGTPNLPRDPIHLICSQKCRVDESHKGPMFPVRFITTLSVSSPSARAIKAVMHVCLGSRCSQLVMSYELSSHGVNMQKIIGKEWLPFGLACVLDR